MIANCKASSAKLCHFDKNNRSIVHKTGFLARKVGLSWPLRGRCIGRCQSLHWLKCIKYFAICATGGIFVAPVVEMAKTARRQHR